jgi:tight adherence protein C
VDVEVEQSGVLTMDFTRLAASAVAVAALAVAYVAGRAWSVRQRALRRLYAEGDARAESVIAPALPDGRLAHWLLRAGYRRANAPALFVMATAASVVAGIVFSQIYRLVLLQELVATVSAVPGSTGDVLAAILQGGPWIIFVMAAAAPALVVRTARRARVRAIEQDLPLALELFATMGEAGLGFDAALAKIVRARGAERPLMSEFVAFQHDMLGGVPRTQALRQLARRVEIPSLTGFTSALIQAEQVGASVAETLQHQANDLRQRRREEALLQAQALPVKLVFPLVICFLPGIFVSTLAPVIHQMIQVANSVLHSAGR